jgi:hypothetical protein
MPTLFCPRTRRVRGHPRATPRKTWDLDRMSGTGAPAAGSIGPVELAVDVTLSG